MIKCVLIGRCEHEGILKFPYYWCEEIIDFAKNANVKVIDLQHSNFCEDKFNTQVTEHKPELILLNGHGDKICATGYGDVPVLTLNKNDHLLINRVAHIISCKTALLLGQFVKDKGCKGYLGYEGLFHIKNLHPEPHIDAYSKFFMKAVNVASKSLIEGESVEQAFLKSQASYKDSIKLLRDNFWNTEFSHTERDFMQGVIQSLEANQRNQVFI